MTASSLLFFLADLAGCEHENWGHARGTRKNKKKKQLSPRPNLSSFLANNLHNFNFSLASRGPEEQQDDRLRLNTTFK